MTTAIAWLIVDTLENEECILKGAPASKHIFLCDPPSCISKISLNELRHEKIIIRCQQGIRTIFKALSSFDNSKYIAKFSSMGNYQLDQIFCLTSVLEVVRQPVGRWCAQLANGGKYCFTLQKLFFNKCPWGGAPAHGGNNVKNGFFWKLSLK